MRLLDGERGAGLLLVLRDEGRVDVAPQLARRVVGHVEQLEGGGPERCSEERRREQGECGVSQHGDLPQPWTKSQDSVGPSAIPPGRSMNEMSGETRRLGRQLIGGSTKAIPEGNAGRRGARRIAERTAARAERAQVSLRLQPAVMQVLSHRFLLDGRGCRLGRRKTKRPGGVSLPGLRVETFAWLRSWRRRTRRDRGRGKPPGPRYNNSRSRSASSRVVNARRPRQCQAPRRMTTTGRRLTHQRRNGSHRLRSSSLARRRAAAGVRRAPRPRPRGPARGAAPG